MVLKVVIENNLREHHAGFDFLDLGKPSVLLLALFQENLLARSFKEP